MAEEAKKKILLIDDDIDFLDATEAVLSRAGFDVFTARSGEDGLAQVESVKPDAIVLDLMLEHTDTGFGVAHRIRSQAETAEIPIIMITSAAREHGFRFEMNNDDARRWIKVNKMLYKPVPSALLIHQLQEFTGAVSH